ncbi:hypothetical protein DPMN_177423 [Dreissena polymorpha]|uniref:Uncharacterized protein n=1 Tax=Dreissena polymorpha TaxID=45954 RepID=A0A9D4ED93_DREPO|nr:hypothetical protein DPMN_177423 [Dreissena polymorpha]
MAEWSKRFTPGNICLEHLELTLTSNSAARAEEVLRGLVYTEVGLGFPSIRQGFGRHIGILAGLPLQNILRTSGWRMVTCSRMKRRLPNEDDDGRSEKLLVLGCCTI